jgi:hypothetical protein
MLSLLSSGLGPGNQTHTVTADEAVISGLDLCRHDAGYPRRPLGLGPGHESQYDGGC